ncbi:MAG TPA: hypothetical protein VHA70_16330 [Bauldia sp.]|nr:hypothetical protein [Bauldia sp.]
MQRISDLLAAVLAAAAGFLTWLFFSAFSPHHEAWDGGAWWLVALPLLALVSIVLGYFRPVRVWRAPVWITAGEIVAIFLVSGGGSFALFPVAVVFVFLPLGIGFTGLAMIGAVFANGQKWDSSILR